jgi:hypothetical protein
VDISELAHHLELIIIIPNTWLVEPIIFSSVCEECNNKTKEKLAIEGHWNEDVLHQVYLLFL